MQKIIEYFVKLWYKMPRYQISFSIDRKHVDDRSFDWYLERKKFGFDERALWNLSGNLDAKIKNFIRLPKSDECVSLEDFKFWFSFTNAREDVLWFYNRVCKYIEWECPYSIYVNGTFLTKPEMSVILEKYKLVLWLKFVDLSEGSSIVKDEDIEFLYKYDRFGW